MQTVSLLRCENYNYEDVKRVLAQSVENLGGFEKYINKGERVLIKVNLLMKKRPEEAATTHPTFTKALVELLQEYGADVVIGDSPGGPFNEAMLRGIYKATGMQQIAEETGARLNTNYKSAQRDNKDGFLLKRLTVVDMLNDVDKVISVSKLKTHGMMTFTGAVKNMFGIVPGITKAEYHLNMPEYKDFANALIDICLCAKPVLSFMDGIEGMEGAGPSSGTPRKVNAVIASDSPYHLDKVAVSIINLPFNKVPTIAECIKRGIVSGDLGDVELVGGSIKEFFIKDFNIPMNVSLLPKPKNTPKFVLKFVDKHLQKRPVFDHKTCISCGICVENCPAKIISMETDKPVVDIKKCIRCYCCQELCPKKAVVIYRPRLLRLISK